MLWVLEARLVRSPIIQLARYRFMDTFYLNYHVCRPEIHVIRPPPVI